MIAYARNLYSSALGLVLRYLPISVDAIVGQLERVITRLERAEGALLDRANAQQAVVDASYNRQRAVAYRESAIRNAADDKANTLTQQALRAARVRQRVARLID